MKIFFAAFLSLISVKAAPTRFLSQTAEAEIQPHVSFLESDREVLADRTEKSKEIFLEAMHKLEADRDLFKKEQQESMEKARHLKGFSYSPIV